MRFLILLPVLLFLAGCASSERMTRLSGGVVGEYSVPHEQRLRSEKFQRKTGSFSRQISQKRRDFAEKSLINIWPFFFRSDDYYSVLWPFFDYDPYGIALRPFFNKEGDDYSVLFPLSSWNPAAGDGWIAFAYWGKDNWGFIPLIHHSLNERKGSSFFLPLFIRTWDHNKTPNWFDLQKESTMTSLLLGYYHRSLRVDTSEIRHLYPNRNKYPQYLKELLAYKLYGTDTPVPKNLKELEAYRKKMFAAAPVVQHNAYGFIPLFFVWNKQYSSGINIAGLLLHHEKSNNQRDTWSLFRLLYSHTYRKNGYVSSVSEKEKWIFPLLLTFGGYTNYPENTSKRKKVMAFRHLAVSREPFAKNLPEMKKLYRELTGKEMPQVICSYPLARLWIDEFAQKEKWPCKQERYGGFLPLYNFFSGRNNFSWNIPALLTFSDTGKNGTFFLSIPLLTYWKSDPRETLRSTAGPIGYYSKSRKNDRIHHPVFDRKTYWARDYARHHIENTYALCGLYYHGRDGFSVAKKGLDAGKIEDIRKRAFMLKSRYQTLKNNEKHLAARQKRNDAWKVRSRLDELKKMVDAEEIRISREEFEKKRTEFDLQLNKWRRDAARFGVKFDRSALEQKNFNAALGTFLEKTTDVRYSEDFGSGIFFRKELAENKDHKWHIFAYLASGSKQGNREKTQILHFLYRKNKDGVREEKIIFPFIAIRKNKGASSISFLWRLWEIHESSKGKGGYIFFIPWGK